MYDGTPSKNMSAEHVRAKGRPFRRFGACGRFVSAVTDSGAARGIVVGAVIVGALLCTKAFVYPTVEITPQTAGKCAHFGWTTRSGATPKVFDTFSFNSEFYALESRLHELKDVVDTFVLVEATRTFSGKSKKLFFDEHKNEPKWRPFIDRIVHVVLDDSHFANLPADPAQAAVQRKIATKAGVMDGLDRAGAMPSDLVIFSDLDEIPKAHVIDTLRKCEGFSLPAHVHTPQFAYDFGCRMPHTPYWERVRIARRDQLVRECPASSWAAAMAGQTCPDGMRDDQRLSLGLFQANPLSIRDGGWHMSYFMSLDKIVEKLESISHIERDNPANKRKDYLRCLVCKCKHVNKREIGVRTSPVATGPAWVREQAAEGVKPYKYWFPSPAEACSDPSVLSLC